MTGPGSMVHLVSVIVGLNTFQVKWLPLVGYGSQMYVEYP